MCAVIALAIILLSGLLGVQLVEHQASIPNSTPIAACATPTSGQDISDALAIGNKAFTAPLWTAQVIDGAYPQHTAVNWTSGTLGAVAYLDYVGYGCAITPQDLNSALTRANYQVIFALWRSFRETAQCSNGGVSLVEFDVTSSGGGDYHALYWVEKVSESYLAGLNLVFPASERSQQDDYARQLFPHLNTCTVISSKAANSPLELPRIEEER